MSKMGQYILKLEEKLDEYEWICFGHRNEQEYGYDMVCSSDAIECSTDSMHYPPAIEEYIRYADWHNDWTQSIEVRLAQAEGDMGYTMGG